MKVLLTEPIHDSGIRLLTQKGFDVRIAGDCSEQTLIREVRDASALLVRLAAVPAAVIEAGPLLKVISRHGVGYDKVDVAAATRRNIAVCITVDANAQSVAEHIIALMLALAKQIVPYDLAVRRGHWSIRNSCGSIDLEGKVLGVVGLGRIGGMVCRKARAAFGMEILVYSPRQSEEAIRQLGGRKVANLHDLLATADVISLHPPLTSETQGMIGEAELRLMKRSAFLINCARGPIVNADDLFKALKEGLIAGAGLDVFAEEPPKSDDPLLTLPNVVLSPHSAALTAECVMRMATQAAQAIVDVFEDKRPEGTINPEVLAPQGIGHS